MTSDEVLIGRGIARVQAGNDARTYRLGGEWGSKIEWWGKGYVIGWKPYGPDLGDVLLDEHGNRLVFVDVKHQRDPRDMFFAHVRPEGCRISLRCGHIVLDDGGWCTECGKPLPGRAWTRLRARLAGRMNLPRPSHKE